SGNDLIYLINDILDLSKIEAGQMSLLQEDIVVAELLAELKSTFFHLTQEKGLTLEFIQHEDVPATFYSDRKRIDQILKNLLSNAVKFTPQGGITVSVFLCPSLSDSPADNPPDSPLDTLAIAVQDSGVGIPKEKQEIIFEAFQQADGSTARKYGGTGLGLSISKELAGLLGGQISMESKEGKGTTFTLYLPLSIVTKSAAQVGREEMSEQSTRERLPLSQLRMQNRAENSFYPVDDRKKITKNDRVVLVIEDDGHFVALLMQQCHAKGLKCIATPHGGESLQLVERYTPVAIILDLKLPDISGWEVLEILKKEIKLRHIPVHIISAAEVGEFDARDKGVIDTLQKPVSQEQLEAAFLNIRESSQQRIRKLLVADQDAEQRAAVIALIGNDDVQSKEAALGKEVVEQLKNSQYDCLVMGLDFPDMSGFALLQQLQQLKDVATLPPVIIYTDRKLSREEIQNLRQHAGSIIIKGAMSEERLLDEASLFLHRMISTLPEEKQRMIRNLHEDDAIFKGKRILLVDDDMRNVFALAKVLRDRGIITVKAEDGIRALEIIEQEELDLVLMDIMMPVMDGYETIEKIREQPQYENLPIIALTAKAMQEDRRRCLDAGANDYLAKPVETERLLALLRLWLYS
ncbi:MAG: response regulator, partial [Candidatus Electrothrix sp. LOE1_4_5]|nr:response regulator [Candidatus Electrothrix gigas]